MCDCLKRSRETADEPDQSIVQRRTKRQEHTFALRRDVIPEIQFELALIRKREIESRRGASRTAIVQPRISSAIGIEIDIESRSAQAVCCNETADAGTDDRDFLHEPLHEQWCSTRPSLNP